VIEGEFLKLIGEAYSDESLKDAAKRAGPECAKKTNKTAKIKQKCAVLKMKQ